MTSSRTRSWGGERVNSANRNRGLRALAVALALTCLATPARALDGEGPTRPPVDLPAQRFLKVFWTDGESLVVVGSDRLSVRDASGETIADGTFLRSPVAIAGTGQGPGAVVVAIGREGEVARFTDSGWDLDVVAVDLDSQLVAVAMTAGGTACILESGQRVHRWHGDAWVRRALATDAETVAVVTRGEACLVIDERGAIWSVDDEGARAVSVDDWEPTAANMIRAGWLAERSDTLWLVGTLLYRLDLTSGEVEDWVQPAFGPRLLTGAEEATTTLVVVAGQGRTLLFDGDAFYTVAGNFSFPQTVQLDPAAATLYIVGSDGALAAAVSHPALGTGTSEALDDPGTGRSRYIGLRLAMGQNWLLGADRPLEDNSLALDVTAGLNVELAATQWHGVLRPQIGYRFDDHDDHGGHLAGLGMGIAVASDMLGLGYDVRALAGRAGDSAAWGVGHGPRVEMLADIFGISLEHQVLWGDGAHDDTFRVQATLDVTRLMGALFGLGKVMSWSW